MGALVDESGSPFAWLGAWPAVQRQAFFEKWAAESQGSAGSRKEALRVPLCLDFNISHADLLHFARIRLLRDPLPPLALPSKSQFSTPARSLARRMAINTIISQLTSHQHSHTLSLSDAVCACVCSDASLRPSSLQQYFTLLKAPPSQRNRGEKGVYCKLKAQELSSLAYSDRKQNDRSDNQREACEGDRSTVEMSLVFITAHQMS
ncbi:unnamed protein product [Leuciscus chuanchicus]